MIRRAQGRDSRRVCATAPISNLNMQAYFKHARHIKDVTYISRGSSLRPCDSSV